MQSTSDPCIYKQDTGGEIFIVGAYVDDIVLAGQSDKKIKKVKDVLSQKFDMKDMGKLRYFLGTKVVQDEKIVNIWIGQPSYTESVFKRFDSKIVSTPVDASVKLVKQPMMKNM